MIRLSKSRFHEYIPSILRMVFGMNGCAFELHRGGQQAALLVDFVGDECPFFDGLKSREVFVYRPYL